MKQFLNKIFIFLLILIPFVIIIDLVMLYTKDKGHLHSHEKNALLAYQKLKALEHKKKIVIIAGSNGGFSLNSRMINKAFHLPVVNTSTHAGIGVRMQFEMYKDMLNCGDIVVFCPEYGGDKKRLYGEVTLLRILSTHMPFAYSKLSFLQWIYIYKYIGVHFIQSLKSKEKTSSGPYTERALNEFGDIECIREHKDSIEIERIDGKLHKDMIYYLQYVHSYAKKKRIKLLFFPPSLMESSFNKNKHQIDSIVRCLKENGIGYHAEPSIYSFPDSLYFDTRYHMTQSGANKRTKVLIRDMRRLLNSYTYN